MLIFVPLIYFSSFLIYLWKKTNSFNVGCVITLYYVISSFFSIIIKLDDFWPFGTFPTLTILPTIIYCLLISVAIYPFSKYGVEIDKESIQVNKKKFSHIAWILISLSFISLAFNYQDIVSSLQYGFASSMTGFNDIRGNFYDHVSDNVGNEGLQLNAIQYFINFAPAFSPILVVMFFYSISFMHNSFKLNFCMILASLVIVLQSFMNASRTQSIYWIMTFLPLYFLFKPFLQKRTKWIIRGVFIIIIGLMGSYLIAVTVSRFSERDTGVNGSFAYYAGQTYPHFVNVWEHYTFDGITLDRVLPVTSKFVFRNKFDRTIYRENVENRIGAPVNIFYTFLGDALIDFGTVGMFLYLIIFVIICKSYLGKLDGRLNISSLIIYTLLFRQVALGLFAYVYTSISTTILIIGSIIIAKLLKRTT